jgi:tryptophanyl-tRNA synthetase
MKKQSVLSGIQPTGALHIGNYLGALKNFVDLQNSGEYAPFFFVADLHSLTENFDPQKKAAQVLDIAASFLAAGLDPELSTLFIQSRIPAHPELAWILNTITPIGELSRMTQYKDKAERVDTTAGLFTYPTLMAADIILYDATFVPTGDDQDQHLELTRTIARKFNTKFGQTFIEPKNLHTALPRVMSLTNPEKKMSKSEPSGCLFIDDEPEVIKKKIMSAVTDSGSEVKYEPGGKAGISNLLEITATLTEKEIPELEAMFKGKQYGEFKAYVAQVVSEYFAPIREKKAKLMKTPEKVLEIFEAGSEKANKIASKKLREVYEKVGLL